MLEAALNFTLSPLVQRLEVDVAAAEEDSVVAVVVLVLAERPHPRPLAAAQLAAAHVRGGGLAARAHRDLELDLAHVLEGLYIDYHANYQIAARYPNIPTDFHYLERVILVE